MQNMQNQQEFVYRLQRNKKIITEHFIDLLYNNDININNFHSISQILHDKIKKNDFINNFF